MTVIYDAEAQAIIDEHVNGGPGPDVVGESSHTNKSLTSQEPYTSIVSHRCGGKCCQRFFMVSHTPASILAKYEAATARILAGEDNRDTWDIVTIHEMLVPLDITENGTQAYTCRHFDKVNGLCTIYERRPLMCAEYPYRDTSCGHCGFSNGCQLTKTEAASSR